MARVSNWWSEGKNKYLEISAVINVMLAKSRPRHQSYKAFSRLYTNRPMVDIQSYNFYRGIDVDPLSLNIFATAVDTIVSKVATQPPRIVISPTNDLQARSKSRKLQQFLDGLFEASGAWELGPQAALTAMILGTAAVRVYSEWGDIKCELLKTNEIILDEEEAFYGKPRQLHLRKLIPREVVLAMFPSKTKKIELSGKVKPADDSKVLDSEISDLITITESWHLPSSPDAKDGRHVISCDQCDLVDEVYLHDTYPIIFINWKDLPQGFWGQALAEEVRPLQLELNDLMGFSQECFNKMANPMWLVPQATLGVSKPYMAPEVGVIMPFVGAQAPQKVVSQAIGQDVLQQIQTLIQQIYQIAGVTQASSRGEKPAGVTSAVAMQEVREIETERFSKFSLAYNHFFKRIGEQMIQLAKDLYQYNESDTKVFVHGKSFIDSIKWSDIDLADDLFQLKLDYTSMIPLTRAGKMSKAMEMFNAGAMDVTDMWRFIGYPDMAKEDSDLAAARDYIDECINRILLEGDTTMEPGNWDDLQYTYKKAIQQYNSGKLDKLPDANLRLLEQYILKVEAKLKEAQPPPQPQMPPQGPPQQAMAPPPGSAQLELGKL